MRSEWRVLHSRGECTIFQNYEWNELAASFFGDREPPLVVLAEDDSGMAIIPAAINVANRRLTLLGETLFDYRDVLWQGDRKILDAAWAEVLRVAANQDLSFAMHSLIQSSLGEQWAGFEVRDFTFAPCVRRQGAIRSHPRLNRNFRRLADAGCELHRHAGANSALLKRIYQLKSREDGSLFRDPLRLAMLVAMAESKPEQCEIFTLECENTLVAALVTFLDGAWRRFYTTYYDGDKQWSKHSPGLALIHRVMEETLASGLDCDFMTGDQPYKRRLATSSVPLYRVTASAEQLAHILRNGDTAYEPEVQSTFK